MFTRGKQKVEDLDDDRTADNTDNHNPHNEEEERQRLGTEAFQLVSELLHPSAHHLQRARAHTRLVSRQMHKFEVKVKAPAIRINKQIRHVLNKPSSCLTPYVIRRGRLSERDVWQKVIRVNVLLWRLFIQKTGFHTQWSLGKFSRSSRLLLCSFCLPEWVVTGCVEKLVLNYRAGESVISITVTNTDLLLTK